MLITSQTNASIIRDIFTEIAATCPQAMCCVVTNPVNSTLPVAAETLKKAGVFDPTHIFGVTTLDVVRASTFAAYALGDNVDPKDFKVPVIGGHSGATILPLYSQAQPPVNLDDQTLAAVINRKFCMLRTSKYGFTYHTNRCSVRWRRNRQEQAGGWKRHDVHGLRRLSLR